MAKQVVGPPNPPKTEQTAIPGSHSKASGNSPVDPRAGFDVERDIRGEFEAILKGEKGSFTNERLSLERQKLKEKATRTEARLNKELDRDLIRRGIFRSGVAARNAREVKLQVASDLSSGERELRLRQLEAEFSDRMQALQMAQTWLDSRRRYELGKEQIAAQREATRAQIALGYAQIRSSERNAKRQAGVASASLGLQRENFNFNVRKYEESKIPIPSELSPSFGGASSVPQNVFNTVFGTGVSG